MSNLLARPGAAFGVYPECEHAPSSWLHQSLERAALRVGGRLFPAQREFDRVIADINQHGEHFSGVKSSEFRSQAQHLRQQFISQDQTDALATASFALVREVIRRELDLSLTDEQLMAGWVMFKGNLAEMADGEGKSLATLLPACAAALAGIPVHLISASDSLAQHQANFLRPVYAAMGISMGLVAADTPLEQRRAAYRCDVTYCSAMQVASDYLQDSLLQRRQSGKLRLQINRLDTQNPLTAQLRLRGLCYAIVDNADTILIDESLRPLILSRAGRTPDNAEREVIARTTFPGFLQRYVKLCGIAANLGELATEVHATYGLRVQSTDSREPVQVQHTLDQVFIDMAGKWQAICERVVEKHKLGQAVLVATQSNDDSEQFSEMLTSAGVSHQLLDGNTGYTSQLLSGAGAEGVVTVISGWAGHDTDIGNDSGARELDGLHIILSARSKAARIDQRFLGYCTRRGEPGSVVAMLSLEDILAQVFLPSWILSLLQWGQLRGAAYMLRLAQKNQQRLNARARRRSLAADRKREELLAFSGPAP